MKAKSGKQRLEEMRKPPSLASWVRLNAPRRDETARRITRFVLAKPRHALAQVYRLIADYVTLAVPAENIRKGVDRILNPLVRRLGHEIISALLPWLDNHEVKGIRAFDGMTAAYPIGRNITVPVKPTFVYSRDGVLTPVFIIGWSTDPFSYFQSRLFVTMVQRAILTQEGFESSDALVLFVPRLKFSKSERGVKPIWIGQIPLLSEEELKEQFDRYGNALDDAAPIILRELAARGES